MVNLGRTLFHVRRALMQVLEADARVERLDARGSPHEPPPALPAPDSAGKPARTSGGESALGPSAAEEHGEFEALLGALGAEAVEVSVLERKQREIAELQRNLALLRPIGDELARVERQRLAEKALHEREVASLREQIALGRAPEGGAVIPAPALPCQNESAASDARAVDELERGLQESHAEISRLSSSIGELTAELSKRAKALERSEDLRRSLRERFEERDRLATERWHELRRLKKRLREAEQEQDRPRTASPRPNAPDAAA